jgi:malonyl-CoA/methylmalonyl-CoA synthetase
MSDNLYDLLASRFPADPGAPCFLLPDAAPISYGEVADQTGRLAALLVARGVAPGDRVAVQVEKSPQAVMLYLATLKAGAVFLPLNTAYTRAEVDYFLADAEPRLFVQDALALAAEAAGLAPLAATVARAAGDLASIIYTSGTTGRSKGAMLTHDNLLSNAEALVDAWRFTADDVLLHALPIFHTHGLFVASNVMLLAGGSMIFLPGLDIDDLVATMPRATTMMGVPTFYTRLLADPRLTHALVNHMRLFVSGSAPLLAETHRDFEARTGKRILERYGMTETNMNTSNPYDGERRAGTVGFPLPGVAVRICDPATGQAVAQGSVGVIEVKGRNVFKGYWKMPEKTAQEFRADGFFITGDLAEIDADGYVAIVGRAKDLIISGGYNIYPKEVELLLDEQPGVAESAVIGVSHPDLGEGVVGVVARKKDARLDEATLLSGIAGQLARFKQPRRIFIVEELPRNTMGKVQKNVLRETYGDAFKP